MRTSERTNEIGAALAAFTKLVSNPTKKSKATIPTKKGGEFSYRYLELPDLLDAVRPHLVTCGLSVLQGAEPIPGGVGVTTLVMHISGQWIESGPLPIPADPEPRAAVAAVTYGRRTAIAGMLGIAADEDDDGASARVEPAPVPPSKGSSEGQSKGGGKASAGGGAVSSADDKPSGEVASSTKGSTAAVAGGPGSALPITDEQKTTLRERFGARRSLEKARELYAGEDPKDGGIRVVPNIGALTADEAWEVIKLLSAETEEG